MKIDKGLLEDIEAERQEIKSEMTLDDRIQGMDILVSKLLQKIYDTAGSDAELNLVQVIVCNTINKEAAFWISGKYKLAFIADTRVPENEVFVSSLDSVEELIKSRQQKTKL